MSVACPRSCNLLLRPFTIHPPAYTPRRLASTTSAIRRGLIAEQEKGVRPGVSPKTKIRREAARDWRRDVIQDDRNHPVQDAYGQSSSVHDDEQGGRFDGQLQTIVERVCLWLEHIYLVQEESYLGTTPDQPVSKIQAALKSVNKVTERNLKAEIRVRDLFQRALAPRQAFFEGVVPHDPVRSPVIVWTKKAGARLVTTAKKGDHWIVDLLMPMAPSIAALRALQAPRRRNVENANKTENTNKSQELITQLKLSIQKVNARIKSDDVSTNRLLKIMKKIFQQQGNGWMREGIEWRPSKSGKMWGSIILVKHRNRWEGGYPELELVEWSLLTKEGPLRRVDDPADETNAVEDEEQDVEEGEEDAAEKMNGEPEESQADDVPAMISAEGIPDLDPSKARRARDRKREDERASRSNTQHPAKKEEAGANQRLTRKVKADRVNEVAQESGFNMRLYESGEPSVQGRAGEQKLEAVPPTGVHGKAASPKSKKWNGVAEARNSVYASNEADNEDEGPLSVPYTTAASVFLYGTNAVLAALRGQRRKLYRLHLSPAIEEPSANDARSALVAQAEKLEIPIQRNTSTRLLGKMSGNGVHNGVVLEASNFPAPPLRALKKPDLQHPVVSLTLDPQNPEEIAVNGEPTALATQTKTWRKPFVLLLDGIVDPQNVGSIFRTAHFFGVDAVVVATNTCAPLSSSVLAKASSGACEALRIFSLPKPSDFVLQSAKSGWCIYASVAPPTAAGHSSSTDSRSVHESTPHLTTRHLAAESPLHKHPCILMLGAEGAGLRKNLRDRADFLLSVPGEGRSSDVPDVGVDSLNVAVSTGVLLESFLRRPSQS